MVAVTLLDLVAVLEVVAVVAAINLDLLVIALRVNCATSMVIMCLIAGIGLMRTTSLLHHLHTLGMTLKVLKILIPNLRLVLLIWLLLLKIL
jgi:hypothetical protein